MLKNTAGNGATGPTNNSTQNAVRPPVSYSQFTFNRTPKTLAVPVIGPLEQQFLELSSSALGYP